MKSALYDFMEFGERDAVRDHDDVPNPRAKQFDLVPLCGNLTFRHLDLVGLNVV